MSGSGPVQSPYLCPTPDGGLLWGPLEQGTLVRRYKRFLADVVLADGQMVTAHTANTGAMLGCCEPGRPVWLSPHDENPRRKYRYSLEMIHMPTALVGINTGVPNRLVRAAALAGMVAEFPFPAQCRSEVRFGDSRLDLLLTAEGGADTYVEIKNCTLVEDGSALFPDAVTRRGARHLAELEHAVGLGMRAILFVVVQRGDAELFSPADRIDPEWGGALRRAMDAGVEVVAYRAVLDTHCVRLGKRLPVIV